MVYRAQRGLRVHDFSIPGSAVLGLVRHVRVPKNQPGIDYHGVGRDPSLEEPTSNEGVPQALRLGALALGMLGLPPFPRQQVHMVDVVTSPRRPCTATAELVCDYLRFDAHQAVHGFRVDAQHRVDKDLSGIGMGMMNGMTYGEMAWRNPMYARELEKWHQGIRVPDLPPEFPDDPDDPENRAERLLSFSMRINNALHRAVDSRRQQMVLLVGSTSVLEWSRALLEQPPYMGDVHMPDRVHHVGIPHGSIEWWHLSQGLPMPLTEGFMAPASRISGGDTLPPPLQPWELRTLDPTPTPGDLPIMHLHD